MFVKLKLQVSALLITIEEFLHSLLLHLYLVLDCESMNGSWG